MKNHLSVFFVLLSLCLFVAGCESNKTSSISSSVGQTAPNNITSNEQQQSKKAQVKTGSYSCEYKNYIFYRNTNDNGSLYRYNVDDDTYIRLFDKNASAFLSFIDLT